MIDPNIWQSEDFSKLSTLAKLVFIGLFSNADDEGRGRAKPVYIKSILFPYDEKVRVIDIETALSEIGLNLSVTFYSSNGSQYYALDHWKKWQSIDKPKPSELPGPQGVDAIRLPVADESPTSSRRVADESRLNRKEEERKEKEKTKGNHADARDPVLAVVMGAYLDKINPAPSQASLEELQVFAKEMGAECCLRAFDIALDAKKVNWPYIRGILRSKLAQGVRCLADWDAVEEKREKDKPVGKPGQSGGAADPERVKAELEWMDQFLEAGEQDG